MKKAVVIGGSGFIGSHVADRLSDANYVVTVFDRVRSPWLRHDQTMVIGDIQNVDALDMAIEGADIVYNFAALADLNIALNQPLKTIRVNIEGNLLVLDACRKNGVSRFIYASTVYVHSREGGFYRCSKQASESYIEEYQRVYGLDYTILRYGSLYGPRSDETNGLYRIVKEALETSKLCYEGHPDAIREYIHVEDAAKASVAALDQEFKNESVVLTGQEPMRVLDVLKMLAEILDLSFDAVEFKEGNYLGHYVRTPYAYQPKLGRKYTPSLHVDFGQGLIQLIEELNNERIEREDQKYPR
ncbi:NAD-dependent epimerase/dehydratase family protein [Alphaproteobacteria bacterium LSUCC0744]